MQIFHKSSLSGTAFEIGEQLGRLSRPILEKCFSDPAYLQQANSWKKAFPLAELMGISASRFPDCWEELRGISAGCKIELDDIYLWNCRSDLLKTIYDSSTSMAVNRLANRFIIQEILASPVLQPYCHIVEIKPNQQPGFLAFYTPGMLPGSSFSASRAGLVQSVNLLDTTFLPDGVPSAIIARAILQCRSLLEALELLMATPRMSGAHHILAWAGEFIMLSVEATVHKVSVVPISNKYVHTNHPIHAEQLLQEDQKQNVFSQARYSALLDRLKSFADYPTESDILAWIKSGHEGNDQEHTPAPTPEQVKQGITVLFRCVSKKISVQLFNADRSATQKFSFSVDKSMPRA